MVRKPEKGPREWLPGPKRWETLSIDTQGRAYMDETLVGDAIHEDFRMTPDMVRLVDLWNHLNKIFYRTSYSDLPTYPVRGFLHHGEPGRAEIEVRWQSNDIEKPITKVIHGLMDAGFRVLFMKAELPVMWIGVMSEKDYRRAIETLHALAREEGISHYLPSYGQIVKDITTSMARTLFVTAWADRQEERRISYPGQNLFDVAPQTSKAAFKAAWDLVKKLEAANKLTIFEVYDQALQKANLEDTEKNREEFGYLAAMEALGHGVTLEDGFPGHSLEIPDMEFTL